MILFYVPCASDQEAQIIVKHLLEKSFIVCANIIPSNSFYKDNDEIVYAQESILLAKTTKELAPFLRTEIEKVHSYQTPCILEFDVRINKKYKEWALFQLQEP